MADKHSRVRLSEERERILFSLDGQDGNVSSLMNLAQSADFLVTLGMLMNDINGRIGDKKDAATTQDAIYLEIRQVAVSTVGQKVYLAIAFQNFPTIRMHVPEGKLKSSGEAFLQLADTPVDIRTQKTN